ncbi:Hypothetical protein NTJ_03673 [Nesidiocoris tenuis]|uniref:SERTA domain-containing protein n=1 Tax=Nesidiocoris tenuis TaxID=355587 RepID=A0ABN7AF08_9HEMI|nr:Hypothetical protein NTJ_03673 [Nesidiocoris tenuis]
MDPQDQAYFDEDDAVMTMSLDEIIASSELIERARSSGTATAPDVVVRRLTPPPLMPQNNPGSENSEGFKRQSFKPHVDQQFRPNQYQAQMRLDLLRRDPRASKTGHVYGPDFAFGSCGSFLKRYPSFGVRNLSGAHPYARGSQNEEPPRHNGGGSSGYPMRSNSLNAFRGNDQSFGTEEDSDSDCFMAPRKRRLLNPTVQREMKQEIDKLKNRSPMVKSQLIYSAENCRPDVHKTILSLNARFTRYHL